MRTGGHEVVRRRPYDLRRAFRTTFDRTQLPNKTARIGSSSACARIMIALAIPMPSTIRIASALMPVISPVSTSVA